ncbi:hypothetical protein TNCT_701171 [Trichonephila clavata]|uniref:Uncharacterized protein n=1 Tax=Trichonephila clavata TaxID=2740835 RepID=A0A8X6IXL5_TRICU|nr:hypothetical protein TNCT_701171 [Trichonephila clavata]
MTADHFYLDKTNIRLSSARHRHRKNASQSCGVVQSRLSILIMLSHNRPKDDEQRLWFLPNNTSCKPIDTI